MGFIIETKSFTPVQVEQRNKPQLEQVQKTQVDLELYLNKRMYYLYPLVRRVYTAILDKGGVPGIITNFEAVPAFEKALIQLVKYYIQLSNAMAAPNWDLEDMYIQELISAISAVLREEESLDPIAIIEKKLGHICENTFTKTDGYFENHVFGSISSQEFLTADLPGGNNEFNMGASGGLLAVMEERRAKILSELTEYIQQHSEELPICIWANVTRGIYDAVHIYEALQAAALPVKLRFYRFSSHAVEDESARFTVEAVENLKPGWNIAVDSFTAGGKSVPGTAKFLKQLGGRASMFLTFMGYQYWNDRYTVEYCFSKNSSVGTLLGF